MAMALSPKDGSTKLVEALPPKDGSTKKVSKDKNTKLAAALPPKDGSTKKAVAHPSKNWRTKTAAALPTKDGSPKLATELPAKGEGSKMAVALPPKGVSFSETLLKQLECPVCFEYCSPPIVQCVNGHNLCSPCRVKLKQCPTCRGKISLVRNRFAEEISVTRYPCPNQGKGCGQVVALTAMMSHLRGCTHVATKCFHASRSPDNPILFLPCEWIGPADRLLPHVKMVHPTGWHQGVDIVISYKLRKQHWLLVAVHEHLFWSRLKYDFTTLDMRGGVIAITKIKPSARFRFQYHFDSGDCTIFKRGSVGDIGTPNTTYNSTIFQGKRMLDQFVKEDRVVRCKLKIMKTK